MSLPPHDAELRDEYSCRCRNITISAYDIANNTSSPNYERVLVGDTGIRIIHHYLTLRTRDRAEQSPSSTDKLIQHLALSCLACKTNAYRVSQEINPGSEAREGPIVLSEDWIEQETLRSKNGWVEVFLGPDGCLKGADTIRKYFQSMQLSDTFSIVVLSQPSITEAPISADPITCPQQWTDASSEDSPNSSVAIPSTILPVLPPLFPPPPFSPSHPVFLSLSANAIRKSEELREKAELEAKLFIKAQLARIKEAETSLRSEVECIWKVYRVGWKEVLSRANEEHSRTTAGSQLPVRSGIPMSIRDFSPIVPSRPEADGIDSTSPTNNPPAQSSSLLSASFSQSGRHFARTSLSTALETTSPQTLPRPSTFSSQAGEVEPINADRSSLVSTGERGEILSSAFKRNMDTNVDIASSVKWAQGEEEMRRRFGDRDGQLDERARKRASKDLGIGPVDTAQHIVTKEENQPVPSEMSVSVHRGEGSSEVTKRRKRKVTFDVNPEATAARPAAPKKNSFITEGKYLLELFDLDDFTEPSPPSKPAQLQPVIRTPSYKMRRNAAASESLASQAMSLPAPSGMPPLNGTSNQIGGPSKRSILRSVPDSLSLLSASVPMSERVPAGRVIHDPPVPQTTTNNQPQPTAERTPSPVSETAVDPLAQAHMMTLLAASAPSHRHAWKDGGKAWEIFNQRTHQHRRAKGAIAEEENEDSSSSLDEESEDDVPTDLWRNPSRFASSLPVQIRPLARFQPTLEPKTSLAEKQGVLVPPLNETKAKPDSAAAIRKAVYDERDRSRSIDPGPALDFNDGVEDEEAIDASDLDRGRQRALSILQARSVVPEAGMWRSMAS
ncbi:hypothetical protein BU17DRAFT_80090 [Hysterangium stoloniferum]|nr:hypothetical protein BU17DRAFT_80090 [Hysterangium stoloniferum]